MQKLVLAVVGCISIVLFAAAGPVAPSGDYDFILEGGRVADGTGAPLFAADVAVRDGKVAAIGRLAGRSAKRRIDAKGLVVAPGFIDLHSHSDGPIVRPATRANLNYLAQGVTTVVTGNCGFGPVDAPESRLRVPRRRESVDDPSRECSRNPMPLGIIPIRPMRITEL